MYYFNEKIMTIEPVKDFLTMKGSLKTNKKPLSNQKLHERFAAAIVKEYAELFTFDQQLLKLKEE
ncbi:MAG: hypothetical protein HYT06_02250 [Candidatus Levybacteria bacterium]|nr:hypothetical protein [Candidatus Levybacteria bacterium]